MEAVCITMKRSDHDGRDKHRLQTYNLPAVTMETLNECSLPNSQARLCDKQLLNAGQSGLCYSQYAQVTTPVAKRPVRRPRAAAVIVQSTRVSGVNSEMATTPSLFDNLIPSLPVLVNDLTSNSLLVHRSTTEELQITDNHLPR